MLLADSPKKYRIGTLEFLPDELKLVGKTGDTVALTLREKELLEFLCQHPNMVLKREEILSHVWGKNDFFLGRSMDVFVTRLRKRLNKEAGVSIETIHGVGYRFTIE